MRQPRTATTDLPTGVPVLSSGAHDRPEHGACFMEYASLLAGERFSDHPHCTHPVLAAACRAVNDHISDGGRQRLVRYVPDVVDTRTRDLRVSAALTLLCAEAAEPYSPGRFILARGTALQRLNQLTRSRWARYRIRCTERNDAVSATKVVGEAVHTIALVGGDAALHKLLVDLLECYRTTTGTPTVQTCAKPVAAKRASQMRR